LSLPSVTPSFTSQQ